MHGKILGSEIPSVQALAFIGDSVHSLYVRKMLVDRGITKSKELNIEAQKYVTCDNQAKMFRKIEELLLEDEMECFKRASNSSHLNKPKRASGLDYRTATGFEAVLGMLFVIKDFSRLKEILDKAHEEDLSNDTEN